MMQLPQSCPYGVSLYYCGFKTAFSGSTRHPAVDFAGPVVGSFRLSPAGAMVRRTKEERAMIKKKILNPDRIRCIQGGFSFVPHRFLGDGFFASLIPHELLLYFLLALAGDRNGVSFYSYDKIALIFNNALIGNRMQFFTDGHKTLNETILKCFNWFTNMGIILDWYHLEKKCKEQLSMAMKGRFVRNEVLESLLPLLWRGLTDPAIALLEGIEPCQIKNQAMVVKLVQYLHRNRPYIPCYAVRKVLGLRNSSSIGEKMNDLVVSNRQKHNGMSWSKPGSVALATVTALKRNKEARIWFEKGKVEFKLAANYS